MKNKCYGCGVKLQNIDINEEGYTNKEISNNVLCKRCFEIKNYGIYTKALKKDSKYINLFNSLKNKRDIILYLCDILNLDETLSFLNDFKSDIVLILTKKDIMPKSIKETKIINYIKNNYDINVKKIFFVSSRKNYNIDELYDYILKVKSNKKVYVTGNTNVGKSSLINSFLRSYSCCNNYLTSSIMPSTTLGFNDVVVNDKLTLIDTPGIVLPDNVMSIFNADYIKKIIPKKEIKPKTYQIKLNEALLIDDFMRLEYVSNYTNSITIYVSNDIKISKINLIKNQRLLNLEKRVIKIPSRSDVVISGIGFIKVVNECEIKLYLDKRIKTFIRQNLI